MSVVRPFTAGQLTLGIRVLVVYDDGELGCERIEQVSPSTDRDTYWIKLEGRPSFPMNRGDEVMAG